MAEKCIENPTAKRLHPHFAKREVAPTDLNATAYAHRAIFVTAVELGVPRAKEAGLFTERCKVLLVASCAKRGIIRRLVSAILQRQKLSAAPPLAPVVSLPQKTTRRHVSDVVVDVEAIAAKRRLNTRAAAPVIDPSRGVSRITVEAAPIPTIYTI